MVVRLIVYVLDARSGKPQRLVLLECGHRKLADRRSHTRSHCPRCAALMLARMGAERPP